MQWMFKVQQHMCKLLTIFYMKIYVVALFFYKTKIMKKVHQNDFKLVIILVNLLRYSFKQNTDEKSFRKYVEI